MSPHSPMSLEFMFQTRNCMAYCVSLHLEPRLCTLPREEHLHQKKKAGRKEIESSKVCEDGDASLCKAGCTRGSILCNPPIHSGAKDRIPAHASSIISLFKRKFVVRIQALCV